MVWFTEKILPFSYHSFKTKLKRTVPFLIAVLLLCLTTFWVSRSEAGSVDEPRFLEGSGTHFELPNPNYLDVTLDSSVPITLTLETGSEMIVLHLASAGIATSSQITISGLIPQTTYHRYEDDYHNHTIFTSDTGGSYTFYQDLAEPHVVFVQSTSGTKFIRVNETGGDCTAIGTWNLVSKTCTLSADVFETIQIDDNGITLDGNGHTLTGNGSGSGVHISRSVGWPPENTSVTIKNLNVNGFYYGIYLNRVTNNVLAGLTASWNTFGFYFYYAQNNTLTGSTISHNFYGFRGYYPYNNEIYNNNFVENSIQASTWPSRSWIFNLPPPIGGNYWSNFDTTAEGCSDLNGDGFCDSTYLFFYGGRDNFPWTTQNGWKRLPIIIVPGLAASWNRGVILDSNPDDPNWVWTTAESVFGISGPLDWFGAEKDWRKFTEALDGAGYQEGVNYFICHYDWRKTLDWVDMADNDPDSAVAVKSYLVEECINDALTINQGVSKVYLIGHSLGGLVARSYIHSPLYDQRNDVSEVVTLGSPHSGTVLAYEPWEGAVAPPTWGLKGDIALWYVLTLIKHNHQGDPGYETILSTLHSAMPVFKDLLPVGYDYLVDQNGPVDWQNMCAGNVNVFLRDRMPPSSAISVFTSKGVNLLSVAGTGRSTAHRLYTMTGRDCSLPQWQDGYPTPIYTSVDGDGTVTRSSALLPGVTSYEIPAKHRELPGKTVERVFEELGVPYNEPSTTDVTMPQNVFALVLLSPATVYIEDSNGDTVGLYGTVGETQTALLNDASPGKYTIRVTGTGPGPYELAFGYFSESNIITMELAGYVKVGSQDIYTLNYDPSSETLIQVKRLVNIDIKPGSEANCINNNGHGVIPVAILSTGTFDAASIDPFSLKMDGASVRMKGKSGNAGALEDINNDTIPDLVVQIEDMDGVYEEGSTTATITGTLLPEFGGTSIVGTDLLCIVP